MPSLNRFISRSIAEATSLVRAARPPRPGLRVLMYHAVGSPAVGDSLGIYNISAADFERQIAILASHFSANVCALEQLPGVATNLRIAISFDDGYRDNLSRAAPVLQRHRMPFTVFVCTGFMREPGGNFLAPPDLRELAAMPGVTIGSHGESHARLTGLGDRALHDELVRSKGELEAIIGRPVTAISYPHGAVDRRVRNAAAAAGYRIGACSRFDINTPNRDPLLLCRTDIHAGDSLRIFKQKLHGDWDWYKWRYRDPAH